MKELEQLKDRFNDLNEELESVDSIGIIRLESIIGQLDSVKAEATSIIQNPLKYSDDVIVLSEHAIQLTKDVDALSKLAKTSYEEKNRLKEENERDTESLKETIARNQEALTEAQIREHIIEGRLKTFEENLKKLEKSKRILIEGGNLVVKNEPKEEKQVEEPKKEKVEPKKEESKNPQDSELVTIEHPTWNIPRFWNPDITEEQYKEAVSKGITEPYGDEYVSYIEGLGLDSNRRAIFWHPLLTEEQILDALANDVYEPYGPNYNKYLNNLGLSTKYNALLPNKIAKKIKPVEEKEKLENPLDKKEEEKKEEEPKRKKVFITEQLFEEEATKEELPKKEEKIELPKEEEKAPIEKEVKEDLAPIKEEVKEEPKVEEEPKLPEVEESVTKEKMVSEENLEDGVSANTKEANDSLWSKHSKISNDAKMWLEDINIERRKRRAMKEELPKKEEAKEEIDGEEMKISLNDNSLLDSQSTTNDAYLSDEELNSISNDLSESDLVGYLSR